MTRDIRIAAWVVGQNMRILGRIPGCPIDYPVTVTLVWEVADRRVRDVGASAPTGKAAIDGLVAGGVLAGDGHLVVVEERYRIEVGAVRGVRLEIRAVSQTQDAPRRVHLPPPGDFWGASGTTGLPTPLRASESRRSTEGTS